MGASRIQGITVEIGGDTTKLTTALKSVNTDIRTTQSQLRDVNNLLKLDPGNTELLAQKHRLLAQAVAETKEKLETLKAAAEQANEALAKGEITQEQYDGLQREIIETEERLRGLEEQANQSAVAVQKIAAVGEDLKNLGDKISGVGTTLTKTVTTPIVGLGTVAVKTAADFDSAMSQVGAVSGATGKDLDALRDKAREMGSKTKFSASEAAEAMNYMAMAGWKTSDMLSGIEGIMNLAAASGEDLATTSDIVTDALTAFGLTAADSGHFADILAAASSNANTNVSMMGETFKYCAPIAGALGFSAEDTAEAIGLMGNAGIKSTQAGTALRTIMSNLSGQLTILKSQLEELAISFGEILMPAIRQIVTWVQGFVDKLNGMDEGTKNTIVTIGLLAAAIGPVLIVIGKVVSAVGSIMTFIPTLIGGISSIGGGLSALWGILAANPVTLVIAAIAALIAIFVALWNNCEGFREFWINLWNVIKDAAIAVWNGLKDFFSNIWNAITGAAQAIWNGLKDFFSGLWEGIKNIFQTVLDVIKTLIVARFEFYKLIITTVLNVIQTVVSTVWNAIKSVIETVTNAIGSFLSSAWEAIRNTVTTVMEAIRSVITSVWEAIKSAVTAVLSAIKDVVVSAWEAIKNAISTAMEAIKSAVIAAWEAIKSAVSSAIEAIKNVAVAAWEAIKSSVISIMEAIKSAITAAWEAIKSAVSSVVNAIKEVITSVWNAIKSTVTSIVGGLKDAVVNVFNSLLSGIKNAMSGIAGAVKSGFDAAINFIKGLPSQALQWGKDIIGGLIDGIKSKISGLVDSVKDIAGTIASFLHFSEPDEGPLSNFHTFMPDMIDLLGKGIKGNLGKLTGPMKELAGMLIPTTGAMESISSAGNGGNGNDSLAARLDAMYEVVTKYLPRLADAQVVLDSGALVGELSDGLNRELGKAYS